MSHLTHLLDATYWTKGLVVCYYCLVMGWGYPCFSLVRVTLLSLIYQKTCNRLSSTNFQGWRNMNDAHFLEM